MPVLAVDASQQLVSEIAAQLRRAKTLPPVLRARLLALPPESRRTAGLLLAGLSLEMLQLESRDAVVEIADLLRRIDKSLQRRLVERPVARS